MITTHDRDRYYDAAVLGLRALEVREGRARRFGPDADATWATFAGPLHGASDRLELLLRDAAVAWGLAFDARGIFDLPATAADDPFGTSWRHRAARVPEAAPTLDDIARALRLELGRVALPELTAASRLLLAGPSAMAAAARAFTKDDALSWDRQVVVVADAPAFRHFAGLCALFAGADAPTRVLRSTDELPHGTPVFAEDAEDAVIRALETR